MPEEKNVQPGKSFLLPRGEEVAPEDLLAVGDSLLAVQLESGSHTVTFSYTPKGLPAGAGISICALAAAILLLFWAYRKKAAPAFVAPFPVHKAAHAPSATEAIADQLPTQEAPELPEAKQDGIEPK